MIVSRCWPLRRIGLGHLALLGLEPAGRQEIGHTDDRVHRRPDFVTHIGQEV
jgi:hypothetical protein